MMETEYKRNNGRSYMIIKSDQLFGRYDLHMIQENAIAGFLPLSVVVGDGKEQFWYDISGYQAFDSWAKDRKVGVEELRNVFTALSELMINVEKYLLFEEAVSMDPEEIYISQSGRHILFCYKPFMEDGGLAAVSGFFEYFMTIMDHSDRDDVKNCYAAYEVSRNENFVLKDVICCLFENTKKDENEPKYIEEKDSDIYPEENTKEGEENKTPLKVHSDSKSMTEKIFNIREKSIFKIGRKHKESVRYEIEPERQYVAEPNLSERYGEKEGTRLVGEDDIKISGRLIYRGYNDEDSFVIDKENYVIGSSENADGRISDLTVSRKHARITHQGDIYTIEDLNSKNGTYVNDKLINYKESARLNKNDVIKFADCEYLFI